MIEKDNPSVLIRIYVLGPWQIERRRPDGTWEIILSSSPKWGRATTYGIHTKSLLGYLLFCVLRQSTRLAIKAALWPHNPLSVNEYLTRATTQLCDLLCDERALQLTDNREGYHLADQSRVWVDVEHFEDLITEAQRTGYTTEQRITLLEEAVSLSSRGPFLEEEAGTWPQRRREEIQTVLYTGLLCLASAYEAKQQWEGARRIAERILRENPLDENGLCHLMLILDQQGKTSEALRRYEASGSLFNQAGRLCSNEMKMLAERLRQNPRIIPIPLERFTHSLPDLRAMASSPFLFVNPQVIIGEDSLAGQTILDPMAESLDVSALKVCGHRWLGQSLPRQQQAYVDKKIRQGTRMNNENLITRRDFDLMALATITAPVLSSMQRERLTPGVIEDFLSEATTSITACWHLLQGNSLDIVEYALPTYLPLLTGLVKRSSLYRQRAAYLTAQGYWLLDIIARHRMRFAESVTYSQKSVDYAQESGDQTLLLACMEELGNTFYSNGQMDEMLNTYLQVERYCQEMAVAGILHRRVRSGLGHAYAEQDNSQESIRLLDEADAISTDEDYEIPVFLSTSYGPFSTILDQGMSLLALGDREGKRENADRAREYYNDAVNKLKKIEQISPTIIVPVRWYLQIINNLALAEAKAGNMTEFEKYFVKGANGAKELDSKKRIQEAWDNLLFCNGTVVA